MNVSSKALHVCFPAGGKERTTRLRQRSRQRVMSLGGDERKKEKESKVKRPVG